VPLSYRDTGAEVLGRHLGDEHERVVMLCPAPVEAAGVETVERARDRVRRLIGLARTLADAGTRPRLYVVTRGARTPYGSGVPNLEQAPLRAVCRALSVEHPGLRVTHVDIDADGGDPAGLVAELLAGSAEDEIAWRDGTRYAARLRRAPLGTGERRTADVGAGQGRFAPVVRVPGDLGAFELVASRRRVPGPGEIEMRVRAAGLSFYDLRAAEEHAPFGLDCAGEVVTVGADVTGLRPGDRVAAFAPGAMTSFVTLPASAAFAVPPALSHEEAATIPAAYLAAYAIGRFARLQPGERILMHAAIGAVGSAVIELAREAGAQIHATAGSEERRGLLRGLGVEHVHDLRGFVAQVLAATDGEGVDVVVGSLHGDGLRAGLGLLRPGGRFIDIGGGSGGRPRMSEARSDVTVADIDLTTAGELPPSLVGALMRRIGADLAAGRIHPLPYTAYPVDDVAGAFEVLAAREHTRKLVIVFPDEGTVRAVMPADQVTVAREDGAYVITGGLGGLGLPLARHLAEGGAGRVVLGDRVPPDDEAGKTIAALRDAGADIELVLGDLSDPATAPRLVAAATATGLALRGVAHAADAAEEAAIGRIDDGLLDRVWAPKAFGAWHLFGACAGRPLDWWLSFSSSAALVGGHGQAAHAGADGWLDGFTMYARARGMPARGINGVPSDPADRMALIDLVLRDDRPQTGHLSHDVFSEERARSIPFFDRP